MLVQPRSPRTARARLHELKIAGHQRSPVNSLRSTGDRSPKTEDLSSFIPIVGRRWVELPAIAISLCDLRLALQFLVVLILDAHGAPDVVHEILIRRRVVAAGCFIADAVGRFPIGIDVT